MALLRTDVNGRFCYGRAATYLLAKLNDAVAKGHILVSMDGKVVANKVPNRKGSSSALVECQFNTLNISTIPSNEYERIRVEYDNVDDLSFADLDVCYTNPTNVVLMQEVGLDRDSSMENLMKDRKPVLRVHLYLHSHNISPPAMRGWETGAKRSDGVHAQSLANAYLAKSTVTTNAVNKQSSTTEKEQKMSDKSFMQNAAENLTTTSKSVVNDALDVATGMAAVEVIKQIAYNIMPVKVGFFGRLMGANSWIKDNAFVTLGIVTVVHTVLKSSQGRFAVNDQVMATADNALRYATFKAVEELPIKKLISDLSEKLSKISG
ncbi:hypothetical protein [Aeromonas phage Akh-2]|nr:hypothetical protein [Aeromonas phage Akh-2]